MADTAGKRKWDETEDVKPPAAMDPAAQAAAIAAKIAATMGGRGAVKDERRDVHDGAFTHDIEINDLRNRYVLTKGSTQAQIGAETGASIVTKGIWLPDKSKATNEPPLYLHIAGSSQEQVDKAVAKVNELINQDLGPLVEDRSQYARNRERYAAESAAMAGGRRKWPEEKVVIGLESMRNFNVRAKVVGPGGMFVKYIQAETGTRVQIKGLGSGFYENETGRESEEPMHINVTGPDEGMIARGKELAEDLLAVVKEEYEKARQALFGGGYGQQGGYGAQGQGYQQGGYGGQQGGHSGYQASGTPGQTGAAATPAAGSSDPATAAAYEQYRAYWAQYGYNVDDPAFQQWQASQQAAQAQGQTPGAAAAGANASPAAGGAGASGTPAQPASAGAS